MDKPASKHKQMYMNIYYMYMHNIFWVTGPTVEPLYTEAAWCPSYRRSPHIMDNPKRGYNEACSENAL